MASNTSGKKWTYKEDEELKKLIRVKTLSQLSKYFGRPESLIQTRIDKIMDKNSGKRWTPEEDLELKKLYKNKNILELSIHFKRSESSIKSRITKIKHKSIQSLNFQLKEYENLKRYKTHKNNKEADLIEWLGGILLVLLWVFLYFAAVWLIFYVPLILHDYLGFPWDNSLITYTVIYGSIYLLYNIMAGGISFRRNYNNGNSYDTHANDDQFDDFND